VWNGSNTAEKAVADWARENEIKCGFFEIANIPNKLFVDPWGVNAQSKLAKDPCILDGITIDDSFFEQWRNDFIQKKMINAFVPQSRNVVKINWWTLFDKLLEGWFSNTYENISIFKKIENKIHSRSCVFKYDEVDLDEISYAFFPLQVSSDSQVVLNSSFNIEEALEKAIIISRERGLQLIVKPHPAENDLEIVKKIESVKDEYGFLFCNNNIFVLMSKADVVITINSTAGLEATILGREVITLGRSYYSKFDKVRLKQFISEYLVNVDYFNFNSPIDRCEVLKILDRVS
jgi:capsular polysaccharide export protein